MWRTKTFKTLAALEAWVRKHEHRYQWVQIFINQPSRRHNGYGLEFKKKRRM
jgi:hypothetical protein